MQIVDSHIHFWNPSLMRLAWLDEIPLLNRPVLPDSVPLRGDGWTIEKLVFVQAGVIAEQAIVEAEWVMTLAEDDPRIKAIVAYAPVEQGKLAHAWLDRLSMLPMVRGVRRTVDSITPGFCTQPNFIIGVKLLAQYKYTFDLCLPYHQLDDAVTLVSACPEIRFALDHVGNPDIIGGAFSEWSTNINRLAQFPNVTCKLSGLITKADLFNWTPPDLQPFIDHAIAVFGVDRVMFGSDAPMVRLGGSTYASWVDIALRATRSYGPEVQSKLFHENASAFYRI